MRKSALVVSFVALTAVALPAAAKSTQEFIQDAVQADNSEIMLGKLAARAGGSKDVKDFGRMLVTDHTKAKREAAAVARKLGVTPSTHALVAADAEYAKLQVLTGVSFDKEFVWYMVKDHETVIQTFEEEAKAERGPTSKLAAKQLPTLHSHFDMAKSLADKLPADH